MNICKNCKQKEVKTKDRIFCSKNCSNKFNSRPAWNKGLKHPKEVLEKLKKATLERYRKGEKFGFQKSHKFYEGGEKGWFTTERSKEEKNINWKGDKVGYHALHDWVYSRKGKPKSCAFCNITINLQWANKSGEYQRETEDWISLCIKCHKAYDKGKNSIKQNFKKWKRITNG